MRTNRPTRRMGVEKKEPSDENESFSRSPPALLVRFLENVNSAATQQSTYWRSSAKVKDVMKSLRDTVEMGQAQEKLSQYRQKTKNSNHPSVRSTATMDSTQTVSVKDGDAAPLTSGDFDGHIWLKNQRPSNESRLLSPHACGERSSSGSKAMSSRGSYTSLSQRNSIKSSEMNLEERNYAKRYKAGLDKVQGTWKLKWDEPLRLTELCKLMRIDTSEMEKRDDYVLLQIRLAGPVVCVRSEIFGLYNVEVPSSGEQSILPRIDQHKGFMTTNLEVKRTGLRLIFTWDHPVATTRRDNYEVSADGEKLVITAYVTERAGHNCKVKYPLLRKGCCYPYY